MVKTSLFGMTLLATALWLAACGGGSKAEPAGDTGQACYPNSTCNQGLVCVADLCHDPADYCGDGTCDEWEDQSGCPDDCLPPSECNNDQQEDPEACDGEDLAQQTCETLGFNGGELACAADCTAFDTSGCYGACDGQQDCNACFQCANQGFCAASYNDCTNDVECSAIFDCLDACQDDICAQTCLDEHPDGQQRYLDWFGCLLCQECFRDCDGASSCS